MASVAAIALVSANRVELYRLRGLALGDQLCCRIYLSDIRQFDERVKRALAGTDSPYVSFYVFGYSAVTDQRRPREIQSRLAAGNGHCPICRHHLLSVSGLLLHSSLADSFRRAAHPLSDRHASDA